MEKQEGIFEVDFRGRKAEKLGLQPANEIVVAIIEEARRVYRSFANYQIGIVDVEMKKLSGADKSAELGRLWNDAFTNYTNLGELLVKFAPTDAAMDEEIKSEVAAEKKAFAEAKKAEAIGKDFERHFEDPYRKKAEDSE